MPETNHPTAAYLYTLSLDPPGLAWEYLRRNDRYVDDFRRHASGPSAARAAEPWGLRFP